MICKIKFFSRVVYQQKEMFMVNSRQVIITIRTNILKLFIIYKLFDKNVK